MTHCPADPNISVCTDIQPWNDSFANELTSNLCIRPDTSPTITAQIISVIKANWDAFFTAGVSRLILGFKSCIDMGALPPVCCRQPNYRPHESCIIQQQVDNLKIDNLIHEFEGPWASSIVLVPKPHQEHIQDIIHFVWHICVVYHALNTCTLPFEYPITHCLDAIKDLANSTRCLYFISLDAHQGFHQIYAHLSDQEKLAFFSADGKKYTFVVMPFRPCNGPTTYTAMMQKLKDKWSTLFYNGPSTY